MADDNTVAISFTASTDDALDGIAQIRGALAGLAAPISGLESAIDRMGDMFGAALPLSQINDVAKAVSSIGAAAQFAASQTQNAGAQMRIMQIGLQEQKTLLDAEVNQFKITQDQKFALLQAETEKEYEAQKLLLSQKMLLGDLDERQQQAMHDRMLCSRPSTTPICCGLTSNRSPPSRRYGPIIFPWSPAPSIPSFAACWRERRTGIRR
jgi:hypothetical protein